MTVISRCTGRLTETFLHETRSTQPSFKQAKYTFCLLRDRRLTFLVFESINAETLHCQGHYTSIYPINAPHANDLNIDWMFLSARTLHFLLKYLRCDGLHATPIGWYRFYDEFCKLYDTIRLEWVLWKLNNGLEMADFGSAQFEMNYEHIIV